MATKKAAKKKAGTKKQAAKKKTSTKKQAAKGSSKGKATGSKKKKKILVVRKKIGSPIGGGEWGW